MAETYDFVSQHNKLFLSRPDWMANATCFSAYGLACGYLLIMFTTVTNSWKKMAVPILLMLGAKIYALLFYHYMEFTHTHLAPATTSLISYWSAEGPYGLGILLTLSKTVAALNAREGAKTKGA
jgi:hypothetical protein